MTPALRTSLRLICQSRWQHEILQAPITGSTSLRYTERNIIPLPQAAQLSTTQKLTTAEQQEFGRINTRLSHLRSQESIMSVVQAGLAAGDVQGVKKIVRDKLSDIEAEEFQLLEEKKPLMREVKKGLTDETDEGRDEVRSEAEQKKNANDIKVLTWSVILLSVANFGNAVAIIRGSVW